VQQTLSQDTPEVDGQAWLVPDPGKNKLNLVETSQTS
jgi:hypothetical protein